jgi:hypothetical protein
MSWLHTHTPAARGRKSREVKASAQLMSPFHSVKNPARGIVPPSLKVGFPTSLQSRNPLTDVPREVSMMILNLTK